MAIQPKYKIIEITIKDGVETQKTFSKELMYKGDAERAVEYQNKNWATFTPNYSNYWVVMNKEYELNSILNNGER